jgi:hypothetical protein
VVRLFACLSSSCATFTSTPSERRFVARLCRNECQPITLPCFTKSKDAGKALRKAPLFTPILGDESGDLQENPLLSKFANTVDRGHGAVERREGRTQWLRDVGPGLRGEVRRVGALHRGIFLPPSIHAWLQWAETPRTGVT